MESFSVKIKCEYEAIGAKGCCQGVEGSGDDEEPSVALETSGFVPMGFGGERSQGRTGSSLKQCSGGRLRAHPWLCQQPRTGSQEPRAFYFLDSTTVVFLVSFLLLVKIFLRCHLY